FQTKIEQRKRMPTAANSRTFSYCSRNRFIGWDESLRGFPARRRKGHVGHARSPEIPRNRLKFCSSLKGKSQYLNRRRRFDMFVTNNKLGQRRSSCDGIRRALFPQWPRHPLIANVKRADNEKLSVTACDLIQNFTQRGR